MKKTEILVVCTQQEILNTIVRLINSNIDMNAIGTNTLEQAITTFRSANFDLAVIGTGMIKEEEMELERAIMQHRHKIPIVFYQGGGSSLLFTEIYKSLK